MVDTTNPELYDRLRSIICPFDRIIESIPQIDGELLDIGSGYGTFCCILSKKRSGMEIVGIEVDKTRVDTANGRVVDDPNLEFTCGDILNCSTNKKFDVVTCIDVIHHIPREDHILVFKKINELLKDDGLLIVKDMDDKPFYKYLWNYVHDIIMTRCVKLSYVPEREMQKMLEKSGFAIEYAIDIANPLYAHYVVVSKKK